MTDAQRRGGRDRKAVLVKERLGVSYTAALRMVREGTVTVRDGQVYMAGQPVPATEGDT